MGSKFLARDWQFNWCGMTVELRSCPTPEALGVGARLGCLRSRINSTANPPRVNKLPLVGAITPLTVNAQYKSFPQWSPSGGQVAFVGAGAIWIINVQGTADTRDGFTFTPHWSPTFSGGGSIPIGDYLITIRDAAAGATATAILQAVR
jgi:hypothetical protein